MAASDSDEFLFWGTTEEEKQLYIQVRSKDCSVDLIERLTAEHEVMLLIAAASSPVCPKKVLHILSASPYLSVRENVAASPLLDSDLRNKLLNDPSPYVRAALVSNPVVSKGFSEEEWKALGKDKSADVRASVASSEFAPDKLLAELANDKTQVVRMSAGGNPRTPDVEVTQRTPNERALDAIYGSFTMGELEKFFDSEKYSGNIGTVAVIRALELKLIKPREARKLVPKESVTGGANLWMRYRFGPAGKPSDEALDLLIDIGADRFLARLVYDKEKLTSEQVLKIAGSKQAEAVWAILHLYRLTPEILTAASTAPSFSEKIYGGYEYPQPLPKWVVFTDDFNGTYVTHYSQVKVAAHPDTPAQVVDKLRTARSKYVRAAVISRPETEVDQLIEASNSPDPVIRAAAAGHIATPKDALYRLAADEDPRVRAQVKGNTSAPDEALTLLHLSGD